MLRTARTWPFNKVKMPEGEEMRGMRGWRRSWTEFPEAGCCGKGGREETVWMSAEPTVRRNLVCVQRFRYTRNLVSVSLWDFLKMEDSGTFFKGCEEVIPKDS